jgi:signal transduction histidine kinase
MTALASAQQDRERGGPLRTFLTAPLRARTWRELLHVLLDFPIGLAGFCFVAIFLTCGLLLAVTIVGLPLLTAMLMTCRALGVMERARARALLDEHVGEPAPFAPARPGFWPWLKAALLDGPGWRAAVYLVLLGVWSMITLVILAPVAISAGLLSTYPIWLQFVDHNGGISLGDHVVRAPWEVGPAAVIGILCLLLLPWIVHSLASVDRALVRGLLGPTTLSTRVHSLEQTRIGALDQAAADLRRIERDLHDTTQARLVALAMELGLAKDKLAENPALAEDLIAKAHVDAKEALTELHDIARGIHPVVLTDHGLDAALSPLAARCGIPVDVDVDLPSRPAPTIEAIAYYCASELLTNVSRHSQARKARLDVRKVGDLLQVEVSDDGIGGAEPSRGTGLRGLAERVRSVDGNLRVASPQTGTTSVVVELPWMP